MNALMFNSLPDTLLAEYLLNPLVADEKVRKATNVPSDKYYTVSVWPVAGQVRLNGLNREVKSKKVSKSDQ